jgi:membrane fusion protein (multidrug efflux system)
MNSRFRKWLVPALATALLLLLVAWMAGVFRHKVEPDVLRAEAISAAASLTVETSNMPVIEPVPATVGARQATTISSRIIARITRVLVRAGDTVEQGQLIIELERSELESRQAQAEQSVKAAQARLTEAEQSLQRARSLQAQGLVAKAVLDEAQARNDSLTADLANARQSAREATVTLSYTEIRSPISGRVVDRFAEPGDTATPGERLLALYNPLSLRVEAAVRESLALPLRVGQALEVEIPALKKTIAGQIEEIVPAADSGSRSFLVKAQLELQDELMPGMYARLLVPAGTESLLLVPREFLGTYGQLDTLRVLQGGRVENRFVRIGRQFPQGQVEILSGLAAGETIVPAQ